MYTILLVDADCTTKDFLEKSLLKYNIKAKILYTENLYTAIPYFSRSDIDLFLFFLPENHTPILNTVKKLQYNHSSALRPVVFISEKPNNFITCFKETFCLDFLIKPLNETSFLKTSDYIKLITTQTSRPSYAFHSASLFFDTPSCFLKIPVCEILFIEYLDRKCVVHTFDEIIHAPCSMKRLLVAIEGTPLVQSHRSFVINVNYVCKIEKNEKPNVIYFYNYKNTALIGRNFSKHILELLKSRE